MQRPKERQAAASSFTTSRLNGLFMML